MVENLYSMKLSKFEQVSLDGCSRLGPLIIILQDEWIPMDLIIELWLTQDQIPSPFVLL